MMYIARVSCSVGPGAGVNLPPKIVWNNDIITLVLHDDIITKTID